MVSRRVKTAETTRPDFYRYFDPGLRRDLDYLGFCRGGISGGAFVRSSFQRYLYPAAIYLGGAGQAVVRAIDSDVVDLFLRAEAGGNGGENNTGGGITHTSVAGNISATDPRAASGSD